MKESAHSFSLSLWSFAINCFDSCTLICSPFQSSTSTLSFPFFHFNRIKCNFIITMAFSSSLTCHVPRSSANQWRPLRVSFFSLLCFGFCFCFCFAFSVSFLFCLLLLVWGWTWKMHFIFMIPRFLRKGLSHPLLIDLVPLLCPPSPSARLILTFSDSFFIAIVLLCVLLAVCFCFVVVFFCVFVFVFSLCFTN